MSRIDLYLWLVIIVASLILEVRGALNPQHFWTFTAIVRRWVPITIQCAVLGILFVHFPVISLLMQWGLKQPK